MVLFYSILGKNNLKITEIKKLQLIVFIVILSEAWVIIVLDSKLQTDVDESLQSGNSLVPVKVLRGLLLRSSESNLGQKGLAIQSDKYKCQININWVQERNFWLLCTVTVPAHWEELLQVEVSGTEAQNPNVKEGDCDPKQSVMGTGISEVKNVEGTSGTETFPSLDNAGAEQQHSSCT